MKKRIILLGIMSILMFNVASANTTKEVVSSNYRITNGVKEILTTYDDGSKNVEEIGEREVNAEVVSSVYQFTNGSLEKVETYASGDIKVEKVQELRRLAEKKKDDRVRG